MQVHVLGSVSLNGGDAAILSAEIAVIRSQWPNAKITAADTHYEVAGRYMDDVTFVPFLSRTALRRTRLHRVARLGRTLDRGRRAWYRSAARLTGRTPGPLAHILSSRQQREALQPMRDADLIAYTGGTSLTDNYDLSEKIFDLEIAHLLGKPVVYLPQSAGPFRKQVNRESLGPVLREADLLLLRDERSLRHVLDIGARQERCAVVPDIVFALARADDDLSRERVVGPAPRVAVSVREWKHFKDADTEQAMRQYTDSVQAAVTRLVRERNASVVFVSTCQGRPEYWLDDSAHAETVAAGLPADVRASVVVDRAARTPLELIDFLADFDVMISTRLHGAISAVCSGLPTLAIAYEFKSVEVWNQLGAGEWVLEIDDITPDLLSARALDLLDGAPDVRRTLQKSVPGMRDAARGVGARLAAVLEQGA